MKQNIDYDEIIKRIGYFMNEANLSARATSLELGFSEQFMKRILNKTVELKVRTLLEFLDIVDITPQDFFYLGTCFNKEDKSMLDKFNSLSNENKEMVVNLMNMLK